VAHGRCLRRRVARQTGSRAVPDREFSPAQENCAAAATRGSAAAATGCSAAAGSARSPRCSPATLSEGRRSLPVQARVSKSGALLAVKQISPRAMPWLWHMSHDCSVCRAQASVALSGSTLAALAEFWQTTWCVTLFPLSHRTCLACTRDIARWACKHLPSPFRPGSWQDNTDHRLHVSAAQPSQRPSARQRSARCTGALLPEASLICSHINHVVCPATETLSCNAGVRWRAATRYRTLADPGGGPEDSPGQLAQ